MLPVQGYMDFLFWWVPNHHQGQKSSGRYPLLWHWVTLHGRWEIVLSVSTITFLEPWNRNQQLLLNTYVKINLLKSESPFLTILSIYNMIIMICWSWNSFQGQHHLLQFFFVSLFCHIGIWWFISTYYPKKQGMRQDIGYRYGLYFFNFYQNFSFFWAVEDDRNRLVIHFSGVAS